MKVFNIFLVVFSLLISCKQQQTKDETTDNSGTTEEYLSFGNTISADGALEGDAALHVYEDSATKDSIPLKLKAEVKDVCKAKGCWMTLVLPDGNEARVTFKDYGFFVPKDIEGKTVIVEGNAFTAVSSVEEQKHFAEDAGKSEAEVNSINSPKTSYTFEAEGVLIKE